MSTEHVPCPTCGHVGPPIDTPDYHPLVIKGGSDHHRVLKALAKKPRTADETSRKVHLTPNETAARMLELRRAGYLQYAIDEATGAVVHRLTSRKTPAKVQRITPRGKLELDRLR